MKTILFFGDSITQQGSHSDGFISVMQRMAANENKQQIRFKNAGVGGNKISDLKNRLQRDVLHQSPDVVVILIGVNDVWHSSTPSGGTEVNHFRMLYKEIIDSLLADRIQVVLATPTTIGELSAEESDMNRELDAFADAVRKLSTHYQLPLCDLRQVFANYQRQLPEPRSYKGYLTEDGVHLNLKGNELVAQHLWEVVRKLV